MDIERLIELFASADYEAESYSGRGMYGKECLGVICSDPIQCVLDVIGQAGNMQEVEQLVEGLRNPSTDDMGRDAIVYWKHIAWERETAAEDEQYAADAGEEERR